jgi:hypothetical protein
MIDFNLDAGSPTKNGDVALILQQIDILFDTTQKDVLGHENFGTKYDEYLYKLDISQEGLRQTILSDIESLYLFDFTPSVEVHLLQGTERDIALVEIILVRDGEKYEKVYKIE